MSKLTWNNDGTRLFETGVDRGVLYLESGLGVAWSGLTGVKEEPSNSDVVENYYDGEKFLARRSISEYSATLEAFSYPVEFENYDGQLGIHSNQKRKLFSFSYRTLIGNDTLGNSFGHKIHIVYNVLASPASLDYKTMQSTADTTPFSWQISTSPVKIGNYYSSHLIIDSRVAYPWVIEAVENILYGSMDSNPRLPTSDDLMDIFENGAILRITDHGDGTWTADGPDEAIQMLDSETFQITWPSAIYLDSETYKISSL